MGVGVGLGSGGGLGVTTGLGLVTGLAGADGLGDDDGVAGGLDTIGLAGDVRLTADLDALGAPDRVCAEVTGDGVAARVGAAPGGTSAAGSGLPPKTTDAQPSFHPAPPTQASTIATLAAILSARLRAGRRRAGSPA